MMEKGSGVVDDELKATGAAAKSNGKTNLSLGEAESLLIQTVAEELENTHLISGETSDLTDDLTGEDVTRAEVLKSKSPS